MERCQDWPHNTVLDSDVLDSMALLRRHPSVRQHFPVLVGFSSFIVLWRILQSRRCP